MTLVRVCAVADLAQGEMEASFIDGWEVLVVRDKNGVLHAIEGTCPHEDFPLVHGDFDGLILTCANHYWRFDVSTGRGISPTSCRLVKYHVEVVGEDIFVDPQRQAEALSPS
jgi:toluene monooxygenase system ferredoxin subunit